MKFILMEPSLIALLDSTSFAVVRDLNAHICVAIARYLDRRRMVSTQETLLSPPLWPQTESCHDDAPP